MRDKEEHSGERNQLGQSLEAGKCRARAWGMVWQEPGWRDRRPETGAAGRIKGSTATRLRASRFNDKAEIPVCFLYSVGWRDGVGGD